MFIHKERKKDQHKVYDHNFITAGSLYKYLINRKRLILEEPLLLTKSRIYCRNVIRGGIYFYKERLQFKSALLENAHF